MDPITLAVLGGGASMLGSWFGGRAQDKVNAARNEVTQAERARQQGFDAEADKLNAGALGRYDNFGGQLSDKTAQLASYFKTPVITPTTPNTIAALPGSTSDMVNREIGLKSGIASAYVDHQADSLGALRSFGDLFGGVQRSQAADATKVGQIGGFKKASTGVEALELDNANKAGNADKMWADIATGLGKVGLTAGLGGAIAPLTAAGGISGAVGATSLGGAPLVAPASSGLFSGLSPFLNYGRA